MASILSRLQPESEPNRPSAIKQIVEDFRSFIASFPSFQSIRIGGLTSRIENSQAVGPLIAAKADSNATRNEALWIIPRPFCAHRSPVKEACSIGGRGPWSKGASHQNSRGFACVVLLFEVATSAALMLGALGALASKFGAPAAIAFDVRRRGHNCVPSLAPR